MSLKQGLLDLNPGIYVQNSPCLSENFDFVNISKIIPSALAAVVALSEMPLTYSFSFFDLAISQRFVRRVLDNLNLLKKRKSCSKKL